jgi:hypothetical protein
MHLSERTQGGVAIVKASGFDDQTWIQTHAGGDKMRDGGDKMRDGGDKMRDGGDKMRDGGDKMRG